MEDVISAHDVVVVLPDGKGGKGEREGWTGGFVWWTGIGGGGGRGEFGECGEGRDGVGDCSAGGSGVDGWGMKRQFVWGRL